MITVENATKTFWTTTGQVTAIDDVQPVRGAELGQQRFEPRQGAERIAGSLNEQDRGFERPQDLVAKLAVEGWYDPVVPLPHFAGAFRVSNFVVYPKMGTAQ